MQAGRLRSKMQARCLRFKLQAGRLRSKIGWIIKYTCLEIDERIRQMNIVKQNICITTIFLGLAVFGQAEERTVTFQNGNGDYNGVEDTFVMSGDPDKNTNGDNHPQNRPFEFEWDGKDSNGHNIALIQFREMVGDAPNQIPPNATILKAELITSVANSGSSNQFSLIHNLLVEWEQETATYNNVFDGLGADEDPVEAGFLSEISIKAFHNPGNPGDTWKVELTELVQEIVNGLPNNGFAIVPSKNSTNGFGHISSEAPRVESELVLTIETSAGIYNFEHGKDGYTGVKDAYIANRGNAYFTNFGDRNTLLLERSASDDVSLGLLRFDGIIGSEPNKVPPMSTVLSANLRFWVRRSNNERVFVSDILPFQTEILGVTVNTFFDENEVTYENFVEDGVYPKYSVEIAEEPTASFRAKPRRPVDLDVTSSVTNWVMQDSLNHGWLFETSRGDDISLNAKEGGGGFGPPKLVVTYEFETTKVRDFMLY